jgi:pimeloyl-ACP methyl ester carboxylesterase
MAVKDDFFTTEDGTRIHYMTTGDRGSWVVLLSGFTDTAERMFFDTGIAAELATNHRVAAYDHRNHGKSDKPEPGQLGRPEDAIELMDHLKIEKAHIYGYSMGGGFTGTLLAKYPEGFITAIFGGSGIWEYDQKAHDHAEAMDKALAARSSKSENPRQPVVPPRGTPGRNLPGHDETYNGDEHPLAPVPASRPHSRTPIDLYTVHIPVMAINGSLDTPFVKTQRMFRELRDFTSVILENHNHVSAVGIGNPMPQKHIDSLVRFISANDP